MMDQQDLINHIVALAISISLSRYRFIDVHFDGTANQLRVAIILSGGTVAHRYAIDLHEPEEPEVSKRRVNRLLLEVVTHLEHIHRPRTFTSKRGQL